MRTTKKEAGKSTINRFLFDYDHSYRLRRLNFTRSQVDRITRGDLDSDRRVEAPP